MTAPGALPLEATLTSNAADALVSLGASLHALVVMQEHGDLDAETADRAIGDAQHELRRVGRSLEPIRKLTHAAWIEAAMNRGAA